MYTMEILPCVCSWWYVCPFCLCDDYCVGGTVREKFSSWHIIFRTKYHESSYRVIEIDPNSILRQHCCHPWKIRHRKPSQDCQKPNNYSDISATCVIVYDSPRLHQNASLTIGMGLLSHSSSKTYCHIVTQIDIQRRLCVPNGVPYVNDPKNSFAKAP